MNIQVVSLSWLLQVMLQWMGGGVQISLWDRDIYIYMCVYVYIYIYVYIYMYMYIYHMRSYTSWRKWNLKPYNNPTLWTLRSSHFTDGAKELTHNQTAQGGADLRQDTPMGLHGDEPSLWKNCPVSPASLSNSEPWGGLFEQKNLPGLQLHCKQLTWGRGRSLQLGSSSEKSKLWK